MRSIEYLIQLYPDKTGAEILKIQDADKLADEKAFEKRNKEKLLWIEDLNKNGGYYKGRFGVDQCFYYCVSNVAIDSTGFVRADVTSLTCFFGAKGGVVKEGNINIEKEIKTYEDVSKYGLDMYSRTTKEDYEKACLYLAQMESFWDDIKTK